MENELKKLFESGSVLVKDYSGHEQMLMNEGTFIEVVKGFIQSRQATVTPALPLPKKLIKMVGELRRGCDCEYDDRCSNCQAILDVKEYVKKCGNAG